MGAKTAVFPDVYVFKKKPKEVNETSNTKQQYSGDIPDRLPLVLTRNYLNNTSSTIPKCSEKETPRNLFKKPFRVAPRVVPRANGRAICSRPRWQPGFTCHPEAPGAGEPPWQVQAAPLPQAAGGQGGGRSIPRVQSVCPAPSAARGAARVGLPQQKGVPAESPPARAAPPRLPAFAPASPREPLARHRPQVPGRGRGRGDYNPAGEGGGEEERRGGERQDREGRGFWPCRPAIGQHRPSVRRSLVGAQIRSQGARGGVLAGTAVPGLELR